MGHTYTPKGVLARGCDFSDWGPRQAISTIFDSLLLSLITLQTKRQTA